MTLGSHIKTTYIRPAVKAVIIAPIIEKKRGENTKEVRQIYICVFFFTPPFLKVSQKKPK